MSDPNENKLDYKKTKLGWIPEEWDIAATSQFGKVITGNTPSMKEPKNYGGNTPWCTAIDMGSKYVKNTAIKLSNIGINTVRVVPSGSILVTCIASIGKNCIAGVSLATNQQINAVVPNSRNSGEYFYYVVSFNKNRMLRFAGQTAVPILNKTEFETMSFIRPPFLEQKNIAEIISTWDEAIEQTRKLIAAKKRCKKALMQQLLTGELRFTQFSEYSWAERCLGSLLEQATRPTPIEADHEYNLVSIRRRSGGVFHRGTFSGREIRYSEMHWLEFGDFLVSKRQVTHGAMAMVRDPFGGMFVSNEYTIFTNTSRDCLHMPFFDWLSRTQRMWHAAYLSSNGVHIEKLIFVPKDFLKKSVRIPSCLDEQRKIVSVLQTADNEVAQLEAKLQALEKQKRGLMQKLLTGEVRVKS